MSGGAYHTQSGGTERTNMASGIARRLLINAYLHLVSPTLHSQRIDKAALRFKCCLALQMLPALTKADELANPTLIQPFFFTASAHTNIAIVWFRIQPTRIQTQRAIQSANERLCYHASNMVSLAHPNVDPPTKYGKFWQVDFG